MPDKYATDLAVMHVALDTVTMPSAPSRVSKSRTLALSRCRKRERRRSGRWRQSAAALCSARGSLSPLLINASALASMRLAFWIDLKRCLRAEKAHIEFHEKVHLSQDHGHVYRLRPCKRERYRWK